MQEVADGTLTVSLANGQPLVAGTTAGQLRVEQNLAGEQELTLVFAKTTFPLVQDGLGGSLGALYDMEYGALRPAQADLHDMAAALAQMVNDTLAGGFDLNGNPGQPLFVHTPGSTSGMLAVTALTPEQLAFPPRGRAAPAKSATTRTCWRCWNSSRPRSTLPVAMYRSTTPMPASSAVSAVPVGRTRPTWPPPPSSPSRPRPSATASAR